MTIESKPKNWKNYFFEFLMLFLAITLGFFVENQRESYNERQQEKQYIQSILEDIETDLAESDKRLANWNQLDDSLDSLLQELASDQVYTNSNRAYQLWSSNLGYTSFIRNDRTIAQLKSGGLRLIRSKQIADQIMKYDQLVRIVYSQQDFMDIVLAQQDLYLQMFEFTRFAKVGIDSSPIPLSKGGKEIIQQAYARQKTWRYGLSILVNRMQAANEQGRLTIEAIKEDYGI